MPTANLLRLPSLVLAHGWYENNSQLEYSSRFSRVGGVVNLGGISTMALEQAATGKWPQHISI